MGKSCIFIGYDRARDPQQRLERTRKHMALLLGMPYAEFCESYAWTNLYSEEAAPEKGNRREDARRARLLIDETLDVYKRAVLLGNDVAAAFSWEDRERYSWQPLVGIHGLRAARIPHTSLRNWNDGRRWGQGNGPWAVEAHEFMMELRRFGSSGTSQDAA